MIICKVVFVFVVGCMFIIKLVLDILLFVYEFVCFVYEVGILKDVFQVVIGDGEEIGNVFISSLKICKIMFIGLMLVGKIFMKNSVDIVKYVFMEFGGYVLLIVDEDVNIDFVVE